MSSPIRGDLWMNISAAATASTPAVPGNGRGSALERAGVAKNITASTAQPSRQEDTPNNLVLATATLNNLLSMAIGQLVVTTDGHWGTIVDFPGSVNEGSFTAQNAANTLTKNTHGIGNGTEVFLYQVGSNAIPAPLAYGKIYYVVTTAANTLQLSLTSGGAAIDITGTDTTVGLRSTAALKIQVDRWRNYQGIKFSQPAVANSSLNFFPAGSVIAGAESIQVKALVIERNTTTGIIADIMDWTCATGAFPWTTFIGAGGTGNTPDIQFGAKGLQFSGPFCAMSSDPTKLNFAVVFSITG